ncbi:hypothetical protein BLNAU_8710 [Blattamonas nauphoetae]|uniref:Uncharacterized protein n=1 Tax=Blattamonas nauphoetae TaxID=2049346 RepID=A0ABQ9XXX4_9EUKA|nr:hypothetical protein BLNAU_8710 [Blattamonas nauphoetae]
MSDLLPSLLSLTHHADPTLSVPATHAVGLVCDSSLSCGDVEGVLSGGVVEKVCSWVEGGKEVGKVLGLLRVVENLCVGLKGALRSAQKQDQDQREKETQKEKSGKAQRQSEQKEDVSRDRWSLASRCQSALDLIENTLLGLCSAQEPEELENSMEVDVREKAGGMLIRLFPQVMKVGIVVKEVGVIGVDLSRAMRAMEEREKQRESNFELKMAELNEQAERYKRFIEEGEERERRKEEERKREEERRQEEEKRKEDEKRNEEEKRKENEEERNRQSRVGAAAIEWFPADGYSLSGFVFTRSGGSGCPTLLSAEFGNVVVRFTFTFQKIKSCTRIGIVASAQTTTVKRNLSFAGYRRAGWDMCTGCQYDFLQGKFVQSGPTCAAGRADQRVVLEADGRDGKRTLRLSQDGQTQPTFFSHIPVPFRFAIVLNGDDAVLIESVAVLAEPHLRGGGTPIRMDEA